MDPRSCCNVCALGGVDSDREARVEKAGTAALLGSATLRPPPFHPLQWREVLKAQPYYISQLCFMAGRGSCCWSWHCHRRVSARETRIGPQGVRRRRKNKQSTTAGNSRFCESVTAGTGQGFHSSRFGQGAGAGAGRTRSINHRGNSCTWCLCEYCRHGPAGSRLKEMSGYSESTPGIIRLLALRR